MNNTEKQYEPQMLTMITDCSGFVFFFRVCVYVRAQFILLKGGGENLLDINKKLSSVKILHVNHFFFLLKIENTMRHQRETVPMREMTEPCEKQRKWTAVFFTFPWPRAVFVPLGLVLFYTSCHFTVLHWIFFLPHHDLSMCLHISSSASFINTTCLLASSSVCHDALRMLWTSCAKLTLAAFSFSLSQDGPSYLFFYYSFLDTTKVLLKHAVENKLPARCMSDVSGLSVSVPLQTCRSSEKASRFTSRLNSALFLQEAVNKGLHVMSGVL